MSGPTPRMLFAGLSMFACLLAGCTSTIRVTDPDRTATEQFLLSQAATLAVSQLTVDTLK